jgi:hypothetical protein
MAERSRHAPREEGARPATPFVQVESNVLIAQLVAAWRTAIVVVVQRVVPRQHESDDDSPGFP